LAVSFSISFGDYVTAAVSSNTLGILSWFFIAGSLSYLFHFFQNEGETQEAEKDPGSSGATSVTVEMKS
jgi:hypothetical protein